MDSSLIEGAYTAPTLAQGNSSRDAILEQLKPLKIK